MCSLYPYTIGATVSCIPVCVYRHQVDQYKHRLDREESAVSEYKSELKQSRDQCSDLIQHNAKISATMEERTKFTYGFAEQLQQLSLLLAIDNNTDTHSAAIGHMQAGTAAPFLVSPSRHKQGHIHSTPSRRDNVDSIVQEDSSSWIVLRDTVNELVFKLQARMRAVLSQLGELQNKLLTAERTCAYVKATSAEAIRRAEVDTNTIHTTLNAHTRD